MKKEDVLIIYNNDGTETRVEHPFDALKACGLHNYPSLEVTDEEIEDAKTSIETITDEWVAGGNYCQQDVLDLRDEVINLRTEVERLKKINDSLYGQLIESETLLNEYFARYGEFDKD